jgi:soluble lytic murein transglycosylase-like protein
MKSYLNWFAGIITAIALLTGLLCQPAEASHDPITVWKQYNFPRGSGPYLHLMGEVEHHYKFPHYLLTEVARAESGYIPDIIQCYVESSKGARGLMQIIPKYHPKAEPCDPYKSIVYAGYYLNKLHQMFEGDWILTLAAYNWGPENVKRYVRGEIEMPSSVQRYAAQILFNIGMRMI